MSDTSLQLYFKVKSAVRQEENYVPRKYQTIGGMWTTDTYKLNGVTLQIMDEGYSARLFAEGLDIWESYRDSKTVLEYKRGDMTDMNRIAEMVGNNLREAAES